MKIKPIRLNQLQTLVLCCCTGVYKKAMMLIFALRKISGNSTIESIKNEDVKEMFIDNTPYKNAEKSGGFMASIGNLFSTHPPIEKRIEFLEQL